jgi:hypothetical protein
LLAHSETPVAKDILMDIFWREVDPRLPVEICTRRFTLSAVVGGEQPGFHHIWFENDCYFLNHRWTSGSTFGNSKSAYTPVVDWIRPGLEEALVQYGMAEGFYQGDFLEEDLYEDWPMVQREQLLNLYLGTADRLGIYTFKPPICA